MGVRCLNRWPKAAVSGDRSGLKGSRILTPTPLTTLCDGPASDDRPTYRKIESDVRRGYDSGRWRGSTREWTLPCKIGLGFRSTTHPLAIAHKFPGRKVLGPAFEDITIQVRRTGCAVARGQITAWTVGGGRFVVDATLSQRGLHRRDLDSKGGHYTRR